MKYYPIDENLARQAKEMNSFFDYVTGSATAEYRRCVDEAARIAKAQKQRVDPIHHEKIDRLLDTYARKLAENINQSNSIATRVPSILISGRGNFPVRKKEKQNRAADANMEEWQQIQDLLDKIRGTGMGGISADEPDAVDKLKVKLERLEAFQDKMKAVNAYYRKHKTLDGCPDLSVEEIEKLKAEMARSWRAQPKPYEGYELSNNNASIRQVKARIEGLTRQAETVYEGWRFDGGEVKADREANRLQVFFDEKPDRETCSAMRHGGFRWAPSVGAWQRQLNDNAIRAAKRLDCLRPLFAEQAAPAPEQTEPVEEWDGFSAATLESIATQYCNLLYECYSLPKDDDIHAAQVTKVIQYLQWKGKAGTNQLSLAVASFAAEQPDNPTVQELASVLMAELAQYNEPGRADARRQRPQRKKSQER